MNQMKKLLLKTFDQKYKCGSRFKKRSDITTILLLQVNFQ